MRELVNWKDHVVQYPNRYAENNLGSGMVQLTPAPGVVREEGTPQNAANFNKMDLAAFEAMLIGNENTRLLLQAMRDHIGLLTKLEEYERTDTEKFEALKEQLALEISQCLMIGAENTRVLTQAMRDNAALSVRLDEYEEADTRKFEALKEENALEISQSVMIGMENARVLNQTMRGIDGVKGLLVDVTLTNSQAYPFNNSQKTIQLPALRNTRDYFVIPEVVETAGGFAGDFSVTDKLLNGFKIAYSGSATSVKVRCHVVGGM